MFKLTFYEAFLTIAMQKYREGCTFSSKISTSRKRNHRWKPAADPADPVDPGNPADQVSSAAARNHPTTRFEIRRHLGDIRRVI